MWENSPLFSAHYTCHAFIIKYHCISLELSILGFHTFLQAQYVQNLWKHTITQQTLYHTLIGYTPLAYQLTQTPTLPGVGQQLTQITEAQTATQEAIHKMQEQLTKENPCYYEHEVGALVWLEGTHLRFPDRTLKLSPRWYGPFKVAAKISHITYWLKLPENWRIHNVFYMSLLTPYKEMETYGP